MEYAWRGRREWEAEAGQEKGYKRVQRSDLESSLFYKK